MVLELAVMIGWRGNRTNLYPEVGLGTTILQLTSQRLQWSFLGPDCNSIQTTLRLSWFHFAWALKGLKSYVSGLLYFKTDPPATHLNG